VPVDAGAGRAMSHRPLRLLSAVVLLAVGGVTVAASVATRNVVRNQERLILRERAAEVAALLGTAFTSVQPSLQSLGTIARLDPAHPQQFEDAARALMPTGSFLVVAKQDGGLSATAATGPATRAGQVISGDLAQLVQRGLSTKGLVSGFVRDDGDLRLAIAIGGAAGQGTVVVEEVAISPSTPVPSTPSSPFRSLEIALYMGPRAVPSALVTTTVHRLPLSGVTVSQPVPVGADTWLIVAGSRSPLVGSLASAMPWIILGLGLLAAALMTAVVETLGRRRQYATALVEERTAALQVAMEDLEGAHMQLVRQERLAAVGQLASSVGHELRNPLGVLMNVLYLMEAGAEHGSEAMPRHLATAKREVTAATLIVSDLLDFAAGRRPISALVEVSELVTEALSVVPPPDGIEVLENCDPGLVIDADRDQIRQVLLNLISNAYDAMPGGGVLMVAGGQLPGGAQITVSDTGIGMDEATCERIFTPFFTMKARGTGLGLAVTKRIVESHGGTIVVHSAPSSGSSFVLTLPAVAAMLSVPA
jgi:signal transduction histidine kinase